MREPQISVLGNSEHGRFQRFSWAVWMEGVEGNCAVEMFGLNNDDDDDGSLKVRQSQDLWIQTYDHLIYKYITQYNPLPTKLQTNALSNPRLGPFSHPSSSAPYRLSSRIVHKLSAGRVTHCCHRLCGGAGCSAVVGGVPRRHNFPPTPATTAHNK